MTGGEDAARIVVASLLSGFGLLLIVGGAFGVMRFADGFARIHALRVTSLGAPLVLAGIAVEAWDAALALRFALLGAAIALTGPAVAHLLAHLAHRAGVEPAARR